MSIKGISSAYVLHRSDKITKYWEPPILTSNGQWGVDELSTRSGGSADANAYCIFSGRTDSGSYVNSINENSWIEFFVKSGLVITEMTLISNDGYLPSKGKLQYSDDGVTYTDCGTWTDTSNSVSAVITLDSSVGKHCIWRIYSLGVATAHPSSNADVSLVRLKTPPTYEAIDYSLPEGAAGRTNNYVLYSPHVGMTVRKLDVFFTYKQDDKINLWEGSDTFIKGYTSSFATYRPHDGVSVKGLEVWLTYRKHDGVAIRKIEPFLLYKQEDKVDSFTIPFGIGGYMNAYALYRIMRLCDFINDFDTTKLQAIVLNNVRFDLKNTSSINKMLIENNTTTDKEV